MVNRRVEENGQELSCEEYREKLKQIFEEIKDAQALRFFYMYVSGVTASTPYIFKEGEV